jgi:predicted RND superfamily exporter protein
MGKFSELVLRFRILIIIIVMLLTVVFGYSLKDLRVNSDILSYLPQDNPLVVLFNEVGNKFGGNSLAMVALETEDIFNYETLSRINKITQRFKEMDEISHTMSLTDILDIKKIEGGLEVGKLIDKYDIPQDPEELKRLREYTLSKDMYRGSLVSEDGKVTVIIARLKEGIDKITIGRQMKKSVEQTKGKERLYYAGIPFQMTFLTGIIIRDLGKLVPLVILLVIVTLYFSFRSVRGVFLPLSTVLISTVWALGIMSLLDIPLSLASNAVPVLLIATYHLDWISRFSFFQSEHPSGIRYFHRRWRDFRYDYFSNFSTRSALFPKG